MKKILETSFEQAGRRSRQVASTLGVMENVCLLALFTKKNNKKKNEAIFSQLSKMAQLEVVHRKALSTPGLVEGLLSRRASEYWTLRCLVMKNSEGFPTMLPEGFDILVIFYVLEKIQSTTTGAIFLPS